jgi:rhodanese-related sulfurtransferase
MMEVPKDVNRAEVQRLVSNGGQLVEVLPSEEYNEAHLPGAINIPLKKLNRQSVKSLDLIRPIITYCSDFQ